MSSVGVVVSYNPHKGWGFINCNGSDVFVSKNDLQGKILSKGSQVQFQMTQTPKGMTATNVTVMVAEDEAQYFGTIVSFNATKGYGFISCEAFPGKDVFVMKSDLPDGFAPTGGHCKFKVKMQDRGACAADVHLLQAAGNQLPEMKQTIGMGAKGAMGGKGTMAVQKTAFKPSFQKGKWGKF